MVDLVIRPTIGAGNKIIIQDQAGQPVLTTADSGGVLTNVTGTSSVPGIETSADATAMTIGADESVTFSGDLVPSTPLSHRNMIINGAMQISQRTTSEISVNSSRFSACDRFKVINNMVHMTVSQASDGPIGFSKSMKWQITTAQASPASSDYLSVRYQIEGRDLQHLKKGTVGAESITISFWVKSYQTGTYQFNILDLDNTRMISTLVTINSSFTWEYKTYTFAGDAIGMLTDDNGSSLLLEWFLDSGSAHSGGVVPTSWEAKDDADRRVAGNISFGNSANNYFQLTGVQLELGSNATPFEHRTFQDDLLACQRYYYVIGSHRNYIAGRTSNADAMYCAPSCPVPMRTTPTVGNLGAWNLDCINTGGAVSLNNQPTIDAYATGGIYDIIGVGNIVGNMHLSGGSGLTDARVCCVRVNGGLTFDAEL